MTYNELTKLGYVFFKPNKCYHIHAPDGKPLGITSESKEALKWANTHYTKILYKSLTG